MRRVSRREVSRESNLKEVLGRVEFGVRLPPWGVKRGHTGRGRIPGEGRGKRGGTTVPGWGEALPLILDPTIERKGNRIEETNILSANLRPSQNSLSKRSDIPGAAKDPGREQNSGEEKKHGRKEDDSQPVICQLCYKGGGFGGLGKDVREASNRKRCVSACVQG